MRIFGLKKVMVVKGRYRFLGDWCGLLVFFFIFLILKIIYFVFLIVLIIV